ncbi:tripartite tricarboxylate transporter TctB family protein [Nocardiopsis deserti]|uniref:tripartite tricarboxylate transporter TctB family protein n=1 Tax=Nocardiopsis deserti TaxID=2605988 RepID=UPI00123930D9|nr:tripartite tricarboxylate transporter TctB family protein [Nocardiopsis deserti]
MSAARGRTTVDVIVGLVFLCWLLASLQLPYSDDGRPGSGAFPLWLSLAGTLLSVAVVVNAVRSRRGASIDQEAGPTEPEPVSVPSARTTGLGPAPAPAPEPDTGSADPEVGDTATAGAPASLDEDADAGRLWRPLGGLAGLVAFFLLVPVIGFLSSLTLLLLFLCFVLIRMRPLTGLAVSLGTAAFVYAIFYLAFDVPFPPSLIGV